jgi:hypothetical protein
MNGISRNIVQIRLGASEFGLRVKATPHFPKPEV